MNKRVVVTGMGVISPLGNSLNELWNNLMQGKSSAGIITKFDSHKFKTHIACEVKNFEAHNYMDHKDVRKFDPYCHYAMASATQALEQSGLLKNEIDKTKVGVIWGSGNGGVSTFEKQMKEYYHGDGTPKFSPFFMAAILNDMASGLISIKYGLMGINYTTVSACASANSAIIEALNNIRAGKANAIVAGGSDAAITEACIGGFNACKALSQRNSEPETASRPFDKHRDGFVMGEGGAALILEEREFAIKRGATILAEVAGGAMSADAFHITQTHPEGLGAKLSMENALIDANLKINEIDCINAHATSTPVGDLSEISAMEKVFGEHIKNIAITATKSMTGHLLGAAGALESVISVLSILNNAVPQTINVFEKDERINPTLNLSNLSTQYKTINSVLNNNFGFGGHNATVIFKKFN
jgi:3-oxoacyl-[acyl-carrier-protein] synthase II